MLQKLQNQGPRRVSLRVQGQAADGAYILEERAGTCHSAPLCALSQAPLCTLRLALLCMMGQHITLLL